MFVSLMFSFRSLDIWHNFQPKKGGGICLWFLCGMSACLLFIGGPKWHRCHFRDRQIQLTCVRGSSSAGAGLHRRRASFWRLYRGAKGHIFSISNIYLRYLLHLPQAYNIHFQQFALWQLTYYPGPRGSLNNPPRVEIRAAKWDQGTDIHVSRRLSLRAILKELGRRLGLTGPGVLCAELSTALRMGSDGRVVIIHFGQPSIWS